MEDACPELPRQGMEKMEFHEALRQIVRLYGTPAMDASRSSLIGLLRKYHAFDDLPAVEDAMAYLIFPPSGGTDGYAARLCRLSQLPDRTKYLLTARQARDALASDAPCSRELADYAVDSVSYALGVTASSASAGDLSRRFQALIASGRGSGPASVPAGNDNISRLLQAGRHTGSLPDDESYWEGIHVRGGGRIFNWIFIALALFIIVPILMNVAQKFLDDPSGSLKSLYVSVMYGDGFEYYYGSDSRKRNYPAAFRELSKAADYGDVKALYLVGVMRYYGRGTEKDYKEALRLFRSAAGKGDAWAMDAVGVMYYFGRGVGRDFGKAAEWFRKAADLGQDAAANNLAALYLTGQGVRKDRAEAEKWHQKSVAGRAHRQHDPIGIVFEVPRYGADYRSDQFAEAEISIYRKAAEKGDAESALYLGTLAESGLWEGPDDIAAVRWYRIAAEHGSADAAARMGRLIRFGHDDDDDVSLSEDAP